METYLILKWLHILSATVLFGTGIGTALYMWFTYRSGDVCAMAVVNRQVVWIDAVFTGTSGVVQPITGLAMVNLAGFDPFATWLLWSYALYLLAFACWAPVVWLQLQCRDMAIEAARAAAGLPERYHRYMRRWFLLGWPAFIGLLMVYWLMVTKQAW